MREARCATPPSVSRPPQTSRRRSPRSLLRHRAGEGAEEDGGRLKRADLAKGDGLAAAAVRLPSPAATILQAPPGPQGAHPSVTQPASDTCAPNRSRHSRRVSRDRWASPASALARWRVCTQGQEPAAEPLWPPAARAGSGEREGARGRARGSPARPPVKPRESRLRQRRAARRRMWRSPRSSTPAGGCMEAEAAGRAAQHGPRGPELAVLGKRPAHPPARRRLTREGEVEALEARQVADSGHRAVGGARVAAQPRRAGRKAGEREARDGGVVQGSHAGGASGAGSPLPMRAARHDTCVRAPAAHLMSRLRSWGRLGSTCSPASPTPQLSRHSEVSCAQGLVGGWRVAEGRGL